MSVLDVVLCLVLIGYALTGLRQGLVVGLFSVGGFIGGAAVGMWAVPHLVGTWQPGVRRTAVSIVAVLGLACLAQVVGVVLGRRLRAVVTWGPARVVDSALGAVAAVLAVALVTWFVAGAVRGGPVPALSQAVATSKVVAVIDRAVPARAGTLFSGFRGVVDAHSFPRVFADIGREAIPAVAAPDPAVAGPAAAAAAGGVVKVVGVAPSCQRGREGSGFVVAPHRVVTNAHVVAGVVAPTVQLRGTGPRLPATVVLYDPERDLAVLAVPALGAEPLGLGRDLDADADAAVVGFPEDGAYTSVPARVREVEQARGQDIYGRSTITRQVYSLAAHVLPGNSGGPLLDAGGSVVGVVFARSLDDAGTGYALTLSEAEPDLARAATSTRPVGTGACTEG